MLARGQVKAKDKSSSQRCLLWSREVSLITESDGVHTGKHTPS